MGRWIDLEGGVVRIDLEGGVIRIDFGDTRVLYQERFGQCVLLCLIYESPLLYSVLHLVSCHLIRIWGFFLCNVHLPCTYLLSLLVYLYEVPAVCLPLFPYNGCTMSEYPFAVSLTCTSLLSLLVYVYELPAVYLLISPYNGCTMSEYPFAVSLTCTLSYFSIVLLAFCLM